MSFDPYAYTVRVTDRRAFEAVSLEKLNAHVDATGWKQETLVRRGRSLQAPDGSDWILCPEPGADLADTINRVAECIQAIAKVEGRSELAVIRDLID